VCQRDAYGLGIETIDTSLFFTLKRWLYLFLTTKKIEFKEFL
jgi:hypothetical protein